MQASQVGEVGQADVAVDLASANVKVPTTVKRFMRGNMPAGVTVTSGRRRSACRQPHAQLGRGLVTDDNAKAARRQRVELTLQHELIDDRDVVFLGRVDAIEQDLLHFAVVGQQPCIWVNGATATTLGFCWTLAARLCQSLIGASPSMVAWGTMPSTRVRIS